jgi:phosphatidylserine decarboxylase
MRLAPGAVRLAALPAVVGIGLFFLSTAWGLLAVAVAGFVLWFHRDPERDPPPTGVVAPADGRVSVLREEGDRVRVGVFMNVTDVHVNRSPVGGTVQSVDHQPGAHRPAFSKESDRNERVVVDLGEATVTLIAGAFARRIHPYVEAGDRIERGERIGHVSFGSRADVVLPSAYDMADVQVTSGESVTAGETIIAARVPE